MADEADKAADIIDQQMMDSIANQLAKAGEALTPAATGYCMNPHCAEDLTDGRVFCDKNCGLEYERLTRNKKL